MNVEECIKTRRSVRKYLDKAVEWGKIAKILDAGKFSPSAGNLQNWKFVVVKKEDVRKKISEAAFNQEWMENAPIHIVIVGEPDKAARFYGVRGERLYTLQNCAIVAENMMLVANEVGLGSCWVGAFDESKVKRVLNMPEGVVPYVIIPIGYAGEKPEMPSRVELEHTVYIDRWGGKGQGYVAKGYTSFAIKEAIDNTRKALDKVSKKLNKKKE